jgi:hypothetical protein
LSQLADLFSGLVGLFVPTQLGEAVREIVERQDQIQRERLRTGARQLAAYRDSFLCRRQSVFEPT